MTDTSQAARPTPDELRAQRRAARAADNRSDILDAAERVFAERGLAEGSLRDIAKYAGFSTAAIYNYFDNKQQLFAETLSRRGIRLLEVIASAAASAEDPMARLHAIVDAAIEFFETYPDFRRMLRQVREVDVTIPTVIAEYATNELDDFAQSITVMVQAITDGQAIGEIRAGDPRALLHFYMTLVYEHVFLATPDNPTTALTHQQFHDLIDGALRRNHTPA